MMNPSATRGQAVSVAMGSHWVCNAVIGQAFLPAVDAYGLPGGHSPQPGPVRSVAPAVAPAAAGSGRGGRGRRHQGSARGGLL